MSWYGLGLQSLSYPDDQPEWLHPRDPRSPQPGDVAVGAWWWDSVWHVWVGLATAQERTDPRAQYVTAPFSCPVYAGTVRWPTQSELFRYQLEGPYRLKGQR